MRVVAIIAVRNEEAYIANSIRHLIENGISYAIIDNASTDSTATIAARDEFRPHLLEIGQLEHAGYCDWQLILQRKMEVANRIEADWVIHLDADEIMHSYRPGERLLDAIRRIDEQGFNVINFDEFVFLPIDFDYEPDILGSQRMCHYYFFEPFAPRLMRAWRKDARLSMVDNGGHILSGSDIRLAPERMVLRHYIFRNQSHAFRKYAERRFGPRDLARGWHSNRIDQSIENFRFPVSDRLRFLESPESRAFDRSLPVRDHYWQWPC